MAEDHKFRRNFILIAIAHLALVAGLYIFSLFQPRRRVQEVMWLDGGSSGGGAPAETAPDPPLPPPPSEPEPEPPPKLTEPPPVIESVPPAPPEPPIESQLTVPKATPTPTPKPSTPKPKATTPKPITPKATSKPTAKQSQKPTAKPSPKSSSRTTKAPSSTKPKGSRGPAKNEGTSKAAKSNGSGPTAQGEGTGVGRGKGAGYEGGGARDAEYALYFRMIHDRLHARWEQPTSITRSGADYVTTLKLRIGSDGTILAREIVSESGNAVMDESVLTAANRVTQIDPLPAGLGNGEFFEIKVNFKLDQDQ